MQGEGQKMVVHAYNPSIWQDCKFKFKASLGYIMRPYLKKGGGRDRGREGG
jgi:hypothetical protein